MVERREGGERQRGPGIAAPLDAAGRTGPDPRPDEVLSEPAGSRASAPPPALGRDRARGARQRPSQAVLWMMLLLAVVAVVAYFALA